MIKMEMNRKDESEKSYSWLFLWIAIMSAFYVVTDVVEYGEDTDYMEDTTLHAPSPEVEIIKVPYSE